MLRCQIQYYCQRAKFNKLVKNGDGVDILINKLYLQVEYCKYEALREDLIRDTCRIVVGVDDDELSEIHALLTEPGLKLANVVQISRRYDATKQTKHIVC